MSKGIIVEMPELLYISYREDRTVENEFYFMVYKQYAFGQSRRGNILQSPLVTINGFEQLVAIPQKTNEEQEAQIKEAARRLIDQLSVDPSWNASYCYDRDTGNLAIVLTCTEPNLSADFRVKIFTDNFICSHSDTHQPVVLTIHTEGFAELFGEEEYSDYNVNMQAVYAPCITEFKACCGGTEYETQVYVNPAYDNPITLRWELTGNGRLEHTLQKNGRYIKAAATVGRIEETVTESAVYTLTVENQKGFADQDQIFVDITRWRKAGKAEGLGENLADIVGIVKYENYYYCYQNAVLYQSADGCRWTEFSKNMEVSKEKFQCSACELHENHLYVMAGNAGKRLKIMRFSFKDKKWEVSSAYQNCISADGHLAFSQKYSYYAQTVVSGMTVSGHGSESDWIHWNQKNFTITTDEQNALYSDLCFWKDRFYAAILCEDEKFYLYECREDIEDALFVGDAGGVGRIHLLPTTNKLLIAVREQIFDAETKKPIGGYIPPAEEGNFCLGSDKTELFGIFSDENFWVCK